MKPDDPNLSQYKKLLKFWDKKVDHMRKVQLKRESMKLFSKITTKRAVIDIVNALFIEPMRNLY